MKSSTFTARLSILLIFLLTIFSCSKKEENPEEKLAYTGDWERTWFDNEINATLSQNLTIEKENFHSNIYIKTGDDLDPYIVFEGSFSVVDNTLEGNFVSFGKINENKQMVYYNSSNSDFEEKIIEKLAIPSHFVGTFFTDSNWLTLRIDMNDDGSVSGDEGKFDFTKVAY